MPTTRQWEIQNSMFGTPVDYFSRLLRAQNRVRVIDGKIIHLSAAFDTVDHESFLGRLSSRFGIKGKARDWLRSYLTDRTQLVKVDDALYAVRPLHWGCASRFGPRPHALLILYIYTG